MVVYVLIVMIDSALLLCYEMFVRSDRITNFLDIPTLALTLFKLREGENDPM